MHRAQPRTSSAVRPPLPAGALGGRRPHSAPRLLKPLAAGLLLAVLLALPIAVPTGGGGAVLAAGPPKPPYALAVLPFADRRHPGQASWLGTYLRERIAKAFLRSPQAAVMPLETATQWQRTLAPGPDDVVTAAALERMGVRVAIQGATQTVLAVAVVELRATAGGEPLLAGDAGRFRIDLGAEPPGPVLERMLNALETALLPGGGLHEPHPPADWPSVQGLYALLTDTPPADDPAARPALVARLQPWAEHPALGGRAHEAMAALLLEQALRFQPEGTARRQLLNGALGHARVALRDDPRDTHRQALLAEVYVFLEQYHDAREEASIARIRNPLESLAFVVLGLVAGLSTGEATEHFQRALTMDPFLRTAARPAGSAPFQAGALEPSFRKWDELRAAHGLVRRDNYGQALADGIARFEAGDYPEAERLLREAAGSEQDDYTPWLYLNRILIELGHPDRAVPGLRRLAAGNPQEAEVLHYLGVALQESGEPAAAQEAFRKALAEAPDDVRSRFRLARTDMELGNWNAALQSLRGVLQSEPDHVEAWLALARVHAHEEDWPAAEGALERVLELEPQNGEAGRMLETVRQRREAGKPAQ